MIHKNCFNILKGERSSYYLVVVAFMVALISCSEEDEGPDCSLQGTNFSVSDISGDWNATIAIFSSTSEGPAQQTDIVAEGGTVTLVIQSNGRFTLNIVEMGGSTDLSSGSLCFDEDLLVIRFDGDASDDFEFFGIQFDSGANTLSLNGPTTFDFDGNGVAEAANIRLTLTRN